RLTVEIGDRVVLARKRDWTGAEQAVDDPDRLLEPLDAGARGIEGETGGLVLATKPAGAEPEFQSAGGHKVERGRLLGQHDWVAVVDCEDHGAHPQACGQSSGAGQRDERRGLIAEEVGHDVVADQKRREAQLFDAADVARPGGRRLRHLVDGPEPERPGSPHGGAAPPTTPGPGPT